MSSAAQLPAGLLDTMRAEAPVLAAELAGLIRTRIPEYADDPDGRVAREIDEAVVTATRSLVGVLAGQSDLVDVPTEVFRRVGRLEAMAGRGPRALQSAYRLAGLRVIERLVEWEEQFDVPRADRARIAELVTRFIDHLADLSLAGLDGIAADPRAADLRRRLLERVLSGRPISRHDIRIWAVHTGWSAPADVRVLQLAPSETVTDQQLQTLETVLGASALFGRVADRTLAVVEAASDLREIQTRLPADATMIVGPAMPLGEVAVSARIVRQAGRLFGVQLGAGASIIDCTELLLPLLGVAAGDVLSALARSRLAPLNELGLGKRVLAARRLAAWLEFGTLHPGGPGATDVSRSTLRYRKARLEELFGDALADRDRRVELILALRWQLPRWEAELDLLAGPGTTRHRSGS